MTAPIQEGSLYRTQAGHSWQIGQLARRPAPAGSSLPFPWAILRDGASTAPGDNSAFPVNFGLATKNDPGDVYFSWAQTDTLDTGNFRFVLTLEVEGLYLITLAVSWADTGTDSGGVRLALNPSNTYDPYGFDNEEVTWQVGSDWGNSPNPDGDIQQSAYQRLSGTLSADANCVLDPRVYNNTGNAKDVSGFYLKAVFLEGHGDTGEWTVDTVGGT